jgi:hypothetical protein
MSRDINVIISSTQDGTRDGVPDWRIDFDAEWTDASGDSQQLSTSEHLLLLLNWLRTEHPAAAKRLMEDLAFRIARAKHGIDDVEAMI